MSSIPRNEFNSISLRQLNFLFVCLYSGFIPGYKRRNSSWKALREPYGMLGPELRLITSKKNAPTAVLPLQPPNC